MAKKNGRHWMVLRATHELHDRFLAIAEYKGWTTQTALERIVTNWVEAAEKELKALRR